MRRIIVPALAAVFLSCAKVPYTNRSQFSIVSPAEEQQLGRDAYADVLKKTPLSSNAAYRDMVRRVGARISAAANRPDFQWEFNVLQGKEVNAFCLPGGKVAFWEGIMPVCADEAGVAVVMGHEIAHALARHGAERMSQGMGAQLIGNILQVGLQKSDPQVQKNVLGFYGLGTQVGVLLPFGRAQESEADHIGLLLMAEAGYDPNAAVGFWQRMAALGGQKPPEFLSTHPNDERRIEQIRKWLPEAMGRAKS